MPEETPAKEAPKKAKKTEQPKIYRPQAGDKGVLKPQGRHAPGPEESR